MAQPTHAASHSRRRARALTSGLRVLLCSLLVMACSSTTALPDEDKTVSAAEFDPGALMENTSFLSAPAPLKRIDNFLSHTPYKRARRSFLSSYYSNGYSAAFGLLTAASKHRVTPRLLLAILQARRGLVGMDRYPVGSPASVEYAFDCGCSSAKTCDVAQGGLDRQFDCLGSQLRAAYDDARLLGKTSRGYGKGIEFVSADGIKVTPASDATAAIYEISPRVGVSDLTGAWLIWNIYNLYGGSGTGEILEGPSTTAEHTFVGASCSKNAECEDPVLEGAVCRIVGLLGTCTVPCSGDNKCDQTTITGEAGLCVAMSATEKICLPQCDPAKKGQCGEFVCTPRKDPGGKSINVCVPGGVT